MSFLALTLLGAVAGWLVGDARVPAGGELETAVYPVLGAIVGGVVGLGLAIILHLVRRDDDEDQRKFSK